MSQWVPSSKDLVQPQEQEVKSDSAEGLNPGSITTEPRLKDPIQKPNVPARTPWWSGVGPFFLSAFFFLSVIFVLFAPLPLLFIHIRKGRIWAWFAAATNGLIVGLVGGSFSLLAYYLIFIVTLALTLSELIRFKKSLEKQVMFTLLVMGILASTIVAAYFGLHHLNPIHELRTQVASFVDYLVQSVSTSTSSSALINPSDIDEWKRSLFLEFPSALANFSLILVWSNLVLLLKINPKGVRESLGLDAGYFRKWKTPFYLVWPTIITGFFLVVDLGIVSHVALNVFKFLMAIYAIQGLSILSFFFEVWNIRGLFRLIGFSVVLILMMPLVLSLGFFDLWFDFRSKLRQS